MPRLAVAYHASTALEKLHEHFDGAQADRIAISAGTKCGSCGLMFVIVLMGKTDPRNEEYLFRLDLLIRDDCRNGQHQQEYVLE
jgi:hypothetical protein